MNGPFSKASTMNWSSTIRTIHPEAHLYRWATCWNHWRINEKTETTHIRNRRRDRRRAHRDSDRFAVSTTSPREAQALTVGIGDNGPRNVQRTRTIQRLKTKISRKIIPYDFYQLRNADRDDLSAMDGRRQRLQASQPYIAFNHSDRNPTKLPSVTRVQVRRCAT